MWRSRAARARLAGRPRLPGLGTAAARRGGPSGSRGSWSGTARRVVSPPRVAVHGPRVGTANGRRSVRRRFLRGPPSPAP
ncbi:hypothetical protein ACFFX0_14060 [Citricoccus parietis]|uniref:Uncharacterized protein n=1 Tax=Citricoccus parietis TaxID=592307 RepID=A0ABV5G009_9MICC